MSGNIAIFVVPRTVDGTSSQNYISQTANKAGSLFDDSTLVGSRFLAELGGLASYCITYLQTFFRKMPRTEKVSKGAQGVSRATVNARNRVTSSVQTQSIYKVSIHALGPFAADFRSGIYISDIFEASNEDEAVGMACKNIKQRFPLHSIVAEKINVSLLNPLRK